VPIVFVDGVHATALVLPTNVVAWALPTSHSKDFRRPVRQLSSWVETTLQIQRTPKPISSSRIKGRLKTYIYIGCSDDLRIYHFRGQSPRYGVSVTSRHRSVSSAREPLKIPVNSP